MEIKNIIIIITVFLIGLVIGMALVGGIDKIAFLNSPYYTDLHPDPCFGWGMMRQMEPPSDEWYQSYCQNYKVMKENCSDEFCGHTVEACSCYEYKHKFLGVF